MAAPAPNGASSLARTTMQARMVDPAQHFRVLLAIEWGVHPDQISDNRLRSAWAEKWRGFRGAYDSMEQAVEALSHENLLWYQP